MPEMDGLTLVEQNFQDGRFSRSKLIMMSPIGKQETPASTEEHHFLFHCTKPIVSVDLIKKLSDLL